MARPARAAVARVMRAVPLAPLVKPVPAARSREARLGRVVHRKEVARMNLHRVEQADKQARVSMVAQAAPVVKPRSLASWLRSAAEI